MKFDEIRAYLDGTAVDVGHLVGRDDGISSRHHRTLICKFHSGNAPFTHTLRRRRRLNYLDYSITAQKQQESAETESEQDLGRQNTKIKQNGRKNAKI